MVNGDRHYMVFISSSIKPADLKDKLLKLLYKVKRRRSVIDMQDNEAMVKRTIAEFRSVYAALEQLFEIELSTGTSTPFMRLCLPSLPRKCSVSEKDRHASWFHWWRVSRTNLHFRPHQRSAHSISFPLGSKEEQIEIWERKESSRTCRRG